MTKSARELADWLDVPMVTWRERVEKLTPGEALHLFGSLDHLAVMAARLSAYVCMLKETRDHKLAVKAQNMRAATVYGPSKMNRAAYRRRRTRYAAGVVASVQSCILATYPSARWEELALTGLKQSVKLLVATARLAEPDADCWRDKP